MMEPDDSVNAADREILELLYEKRLPVLRQALVDRLAGLAKARCVVLLERDAGRWCVTGQAGEGALRTADEFLGGRRPVEPPDQPAPGGGLVTIAPEDVVVRLWHPREPLRVLYARRGPGESPLDASEAVGLERLAPYLAVALANAVGKEESIGGAAAGGLDEALQAREREIRGGHYRFLSAMSRELRAPLTAVIGFSEALAGGYDPASDPDTAEIVLRNSRRLAALLDDAADLARVEAGRLNVQLAPMSPFELVDQVQSRLALGLRERRLSLDIDFLWPLPSRISGDAARLARVLLEMCRQGLRAPKDPVLTLGVEWQEPVQRMRFSLGGLRIPGAVGLARVFDPFSVVAGRLQGDQGTGLGLALARKLSLAMGGALTAEENGDGGMTLELSLPTHEAAGAELLHAWPGEARKLAGSPEGPGEAGQLAGHVLLAEDGPDNQRLISFYVKQSGADITVVNNGREAVETALPWDFDLVLMDMHLAEVDGLQAVRLLREAGFSRPIVALTGETAPDYLDECLNVGCVATLAKPIDHREFRRLLQRYLPPGDRVVSVLEVDTRELTREFVSALDRYLGPLEQALEGEDWPSAVAEAHKLKGTAGNFGFPRISRFAAELERAVKSGSVQEASLRTTFAQLLSACDDARNDYSA